MFRRAKVLLHRYVFQYLTVRTVIGFIVVYSLLNTLKYGAAYYKNFERFYVKVSEIQLDVLTNNARQKKIISVSEAPNIK